ncbi:MAG: hypothetical protein EAZ73_09150 [Oscillatoriales cyanobacterium]|uniref:hypothetical protein n=1 Tax=unclassified Microcoleus TaxID=2642155 RepID=UPI001D3C3EA9|nr:MULTISPECIES: hypothetical protein [unclassified Microcoleus]TAF00859.1 MAG: hypothetical protein EAZ79_01445 [Oscillatoriales cyanobacterium]MCC3459803.1 hypothetical protein [Microcoleus sp. PH2017_11_PCY_U_A]MCC3478237.1 hypothetical protein [Microcoleus sp. PH2017_12_PCY_D_A]TAF21382.1 MAG: hypothetical protein EAZ73_09150 [Oscillatoriales cyanobacterium]TAF39691.1 MAG: hypothetical protein EAZ69_00195 [Oscillatoriales cyanobacterium]
MTINIPSFTEKRASQLRDAVRIIAWDAYKQENKVKGKDVAYKAYEAFDIEWKAHPIHKLDYEGVVEFAQDLGYEIKDLLAVRTEHYVRRNELNGTAKKPNLATNVADDRYDF